MFVFVLPIFFSLVKYFLESFLELGSNYFLRLVYFILCAYLTIKIYFVVIEFTAL